MSFIYSTEWNFYFICSALYLFLWLFFSLIHAYCFKSTKSKFLTNFNDILLPDWLKSISKFFLKVMQYRSVRWKLPSNRLAIVCYWYRKFIWSLPFNILLKNVNTFFNDMFVLRLETSMAILTPFWIFQ